MWQDKLKEIIYILENSNVNEIEINFWGRKYRVVKSSYTTAVDKEKQYSYTHNQIETISEKEPEKDKFDKTNTNDENLEKLLSPMPGTFYSSPTPEDPAFVKKGEKVKKGQILCIIEAMKIMNEIESDYDGTIVDVCIENGEAVEYNQPLFVIKPI